MFGIAVNQSRSSVRQVRRQPILIDGGQIDVLIGAAISPHDTVTAVETSQIVQQAVSQLPEQQRQVLVLRVWNGLSYQVIGQILERDEGTVRSHMHHALQSLRKHLAPHLREANI
jgi:RNA polymerase sigma factor (sigma-70 family)